MNKRLINNILVVIIIVLIMILAFFVIRPILVSIIFGMIFAYVLHPVYRKLNKNIKNKSLAAAILMLLIAVLVVAPAIYYTPIMIEQMFDLFDEIRQINIAEIITVFLPFIGKDTTAYSILLSLNNVPGRLVSSVMDYFFSLVMNLPSILLQIFVFLFTVFYGVRDSEKLKEYVAEISPFSRATEKRFLREFRNITNTVVLGQVLIGIIQGLALGVCLWLLGVSNVLTWTILAIVASIIPIIGAWLVWIPIAVFMLVQGQTTSAIILVLYGSIFVSNIDNFMRPYLLSRSSKLPVVVSLAGTIGGLYFLGIIGLVLGPLILAYALIIIDFYREGRLDELYREIKQQGGSIASYEIKN